MKSFLSFTNKSPKSMDPENEEEETEDNASSSKLFIEARRKSKRGKTTDALKRRTTTQELKERASWQEIKISNQAGKIKILRMKVKELLQIVDE